MRKWMSDRIKRRKKEPDGNKAEPAQAPLQPAYFESEAAASPAKHQRSDDARPVIGENQPAEAESKLSARMRDSRDISADELRSPEAKSENANEPGQPTAASQVRRTINNPGQSRRRRGRGGRGRGGRRVDSAVAGASSFPANSEASGISEAGEGAAQPVTAAAQEQSPKPRVSKGVVVLAIGLPGSGKSSWFKRHSISPLSSDLLRALLFDDPTEQRFQDLVFSNLRSMLKARLIARRPMNYVDATNLTSHDRRGWIKLAQDYGYEVQAVFFDVPLDVCLERNRKRERVVSEDVMGRMAAKQKPPTFEEGFSKITVVRVKQKE
jgi:predicted kinase